MTVGIQALAKSRGAHRPNEFVNEHIAGELARALRLPVAEGVFISKDRDRWHASFNFNSWAPAKLPRLIPLWASRVGEERPVDAAGIVAFDMWVCNEDRNPTNIAWNDDAGEVFIFDQGESLLQGNAPRDRLERIRRNNLLGVGSHCLLREIRDVSTLNPWFDRITAILDGFIRQLIVEAEPLGLRKSDGEFLAEYLLERRSLLSNLVALNIAEFAKAGWDFAEQKAKKPRLSKKRTIARTAAILSRQMRFCSECGSKFRKAGRGCQ